MTGSDSKGRQPTAGKVVFGRFPPRAVAPNEVAESVPPDLVQAEATAADLSRATDFFFFGGPREVTLRAKRLELDAVPAGMLAELHAYWRSKCPDGGLPPRQLIDPLDFRAALGRICLFEVLREPLRFRYRLDGSLIAEHRGRDMTGRTTDEVMPAELGAILRSQYSRVVETGTPAYFEVSFTRDQEVAVSRCLALPLSERGDRVDMILACAQGTEAVKDFF